MRVLLQTLRTPLVASAFFFFWAGAVVFSWVVCPVLLVVEHDRIRRRRFCQGLARRAFRLFHAYMDVLALVRMELVGDHRDRPAGAFVMVSNHPTLVDATAILASYDAVCCVVKTSLIRNFFVGRFVRFCGHIDGGDGEVMSGAATVQEAQRRLDDGEGVLIFPEGGRSPRRGMRRFRRGAFELATRADVPLVPMFVACDPPALSRGVPIWRHPVTAARQRLTPQPPVFASHASGPPASSRALCRQVEGACRAWLTERELIEPAAEAPTPPLKVDEPCAPSYQLRVDAGGVGETSR